MQLMCFFWRGGVWSDRILFATRIVISYSGFRLIGYQDLRSCSFELVALGFQHFGVQLGPALSSARTKDLGFRT